MSLRSSQDLDHLFELFHLVSNYPSFLQSRINFLHKHVGYHNRKVVSVVVLFGVLSDEDQLFDHLLTPMVFVDIVKDVECFNNVIVLWLEKLNKVIDCCHRIMSEQFLFAIFYKLSQAFLSLCFITFSLEP